MPLGYLSVYTYKLKTDNFSSIYDALSNLQLPVSALDIRKVQAIVKEIYSGGNISVKITEDLDTIKNSERILAIGTDKTISYQFLTSSETIANYFKIIDESNSQILSLIDKYSISVNQFFPIYGFSTINKAISCSEKLKQQQYNKLTVTLKTINQTCKHTHSTIKQVLEDTHISHSSKENSVFWGTMQGNLKLDDVEEYLRNYPDKKLSSYKRVLCGYDYMMYK